MTDEPAPPRTVPTELAALAAGVSEATIRKWASRGKIARYGTPGRACYDIAELLELAARRSGAEPPEPTPDADRRPNGEEPGSPLIP